MDTENVNVRRIEMKDFKPETVAELYGGIDREVDLANTHACLRISHGSKPGTIKWESDGLIVSFNGGGDVTRNSPTYRDSADLAKSVINAGGLVLNGGRHSGVMQATAEASGEHGLGIVFPGQVKKDVVNTHGQKLVVDSPITRLALLTNLPSTVVVYEGQIGTLHELINAIVAVKNTQYCLPAPKIIASAKWRESLETLGKQGVIPDKYIKAVQFFGSTDEARKELNL